MLESTMTKRFDFSPASIDSLARQDVARALHEDVGDGDLTAGLIDPMRQTRARIVAREDAVLCGAPWVTAAVLQMDD